MFAALMRQICKVKTFFHILGERMQAKDKSPGVKHLLKRYFLGENRSTFFLDLPH